MSSLVHKIAAGVLAVCSLLATTARADEHEDEDQPPTPAHRRGWALLPGVSYSPDNGLTLAASGLLYTGLGQAPQRPSQVKGSVELSIVGNREAVVSPKVWLQDDLYQLSLKLKARDAQRDYFGIGNESVEDNRELYRSTQIGARGRAAREVYDNLFLSLIFDLQSRRITETAQDSEIESYVAEQGASAIDVGAGLEVRYDSRDTPYLPTRGLRAISRIRAYDRAWGSSQSFIAQYNEFIAFRQIYPGHTLSLDLQTEIRSEGARFDNLALAGGNRLLRGIVRGRYRDHIFVGGQLEYRFPLYWRVGGVAFVGTGRVARALGQLDLDGWKQSVGGGLRFRVTRAGVRVRADVGRTDGTTGFYLNLLEAF